VVQVSLTSAGTAVHLARERGSRWFSIWTLELTQNDVLYPTEIASSSTAAAWSGKVGDAWGAVTDRLWSEAHPGRHEEYRRALNRYWQTQGLETDDAYQILVCLLDELGVTDEVEETASTFVGNARVKEAWGGAVNVPAHADPTTYRRSRALSTLTILSSAMVGLLAKPLSGKSTSVKATDNATIAVPL
jgi:uncharacterized protein YjbJ (UPF0337 family)